MYCFNLEQWQKRRTVHEQQTSRTDVLWHPHDSSITPKEAKTTKKTKDNKITSQAAPVVIISTSAKKTSPSVVTE